MTVRLFHEWKKLSPNDPKLLGATIDQIHRGVQIISMVGKFYVKNEPDDSHTNKEWINDLEVLAGNWAESPKGKIRFAMRPSTLTLIMYDSQMREIDNCNLNGLTNGQILGWVKIHLFQYGLESDKMKLDIHYDIPFHETDDGIPYQYLNPVYFAEMAKYRANSDLLLRHFAAQYKTASDVRTWPHHFDHGAYIPMAFDDNGNATKSFSIGLGIPDPASEEPYFYITTWSAADDNTYDNLPALPSGEWLTTPFNGAVLRASEIIKEDTGNSQAALVRDFFDKGIEYSKAILGI